MYYLELFRHALKFGPRSDHRSQITDHRSQITDHRSQIRSDQIRSDQIRSIRSDRSDQISNHRSGSHGYCTPCQVYLPDITGLGCMVIVPPVRYIYLTSQVRAAWLYILSPVGYIYHLTSQVRVVWLFYPRSGIFTRQSLTMSDILFYNCSPGRPVVLQHVG